MSGLIGVANPGEVALAAGVAKTVLQIVAPANHRLRVKSVAFLFDGTSASAEPVKVRVLKQTTAGTMSALTPVKVTPGSETLQATAQHTATAEPTAGDVMMQRDIHPQAGYEKVFPPDQELIVAGGERLGIECTAAAAVNVIPEIVFEE